MAEPLKLPPGATLVNNGAKLPPGATIAGDAGTPPEDDRNFIQKAFDNATTVTPEQEKGHSWLTNKIQEFGAGAIQGVGQPFIHPIETAAGIAKFAANPLLSGGEMAHNAVEHPAQTLGNIVGGADLGLAGEATLGKVVDAIPTKAKAGKLFEGVMQKAANEPVEMLNSRPVLDRVMQLSDRGHGTVGAADKLFARSNTVNPINYGEARDFSSSLSRLSGQDQMAASPTLRAEIGKLSHAFGQDVGSAADRVGMGEQYQQAMRDYARASQYGDVAKTVGKWAVPAVLGGGVLGKVLTSGMK